MFRGSRFPLCFPKHQTNLRAKKALRRLSEHHLGRMTGGTVLKNENTKVRPFPASRPRRAPTPPPRRSFLTSRRAAPAPSPSLRAAGAGDRGLRVADDAGRRPDATADAAFLNDRSSNGDFYPPGSLRWARTPSRGDRSGRTGARDACGSAGAPRGLRVQLRHTRRPARRGPQGRRKGRGGSLAPDAGSGPT